MSFHFDDVFSLGGKPFFPLIHIGEDEPEKGFNVVTIELNLRQHSNLDWELQKSKALEYVKRGFFIIWDLEMGLFEGLSFPLSDEMQLLSFQMALDHFKNKIWAEFKEYTFGIVLYKGSLDFQLRWTSEEEVLFQEWLQGKESSDTRRRLFKRDICVDYFHLLLANLPDELFAFLLFQLPPSIDDGEFLRLTSKEYFSHFHLCFQGVNPFPFCRPFLAWGEEFQSDVGGFFQNVPLNNPPSRQKSKKALLLPPSSIQYDESWQEVKKELKKQISFRVIEIPFLTEEWDGLDKLIVFPSALEPQGKRKIAGFLAAGGEVIEIPGITRNSLNV